MNRIVFRAYKREFVDLTRRVLRTHRSAALSEAAFPAYANPNPLISFLFWERVRRVMRHLGDHPRGCILDFGCGGGVMLPFLAERARQVVAMDLDLGPLHRLAEHRPLPANVEPCDARTMALSAFPPGAFDTILALDVLEHVADLEGTVAELFRVLAPGGEIIVSGPTENRAYRLGRALAGPDYSGDYHLRDIAGVRPVLARRATVRRVATLFPLVPLFRIYSARTASA